VKEHIPVHPETLRGRLVDIRFGHLDGIDFVGDANPLLQVLIGATLELHLANGHVMNGVVIPFGLVEVKIGVQIGVLEVDKDVVRCNIEHEGIGVSV